MFQRKPDLGDEYYRLDVRAKKTLTNSMNVFRKVMGNRQDLKDSTEKEVQRFLRGGGAPVFGYSHMDYSGRHAATAEEFDEDNRKLWRALSQSILQCPDGPRSELVQVLARRKSGGPVTDAELGDLLRGGRHSATCREDASGMGLLVGVQRQAARDRKALRSFLKSSTPYRVGLGRAKAGPFASRSKDRNLSADVARGTKARSPEPRAPQR